MDMNLIHSVPSAYQTPSSFYAVVEISSGSSAKYEIDHESGALILDRFLYTSTHYPHNYGFIPKTWGGDEDPLDVLIVSSGPIVPLAMVKCYPIGVLTMIDSGKEDVKIIAIPEKDPFYNAFHSVEALPDHVEEEIRHFFTVYKELEHGKTTVVQGYGGVKEAEEAIGKGLIRYQKKFPSEE